MGGGPRFALLRGGPGGGGGIGTGKSGIVPTDEMVDGRDDWVIGEVTEGDVTSSSGYLELFP